MAEDFGAIVDRLAAELPKAEGQPDPLRGELLVLRAQARELRALNGDPQGKDLYAWTDRLAAAVRRQHPQSKCQSGCAGCCSSATALFLASKAEWGAIERHVAERWDEAQRTRFQARFEAQHRPWVRLYRWAWAWSRVDRLEAWVWGDRPYLCPFLEEGRCTVYAARPLACRMYGHFAMPHGLGRPPGVYACRLQTDVYEEAADLALPSVDMVWAASRPFVGPSLRLLPAWVAKRWPQARPPGEGP